MTSLTECDEKLIVLEIDVQEGEGLRVAEQVAPLAEQVAKVREEAVVERHLEAGRRRLDTQRRVLIDALDQVCDKHRLAEHELRVRTERVVPLVVEARGVVHVRAIERVHDGHEALEASESTLVVAGVLLERDVSRILLVADEAVEASACGEHALGELRVVVEQEDLGERERAHVASRLAAVLGQQAHDVRVHVVGGDGLARLVAIHGLGRGEHVQGGGGGGGHGRVKARKDELVVVVVAHQLVAVTHAHVAVVGAQTLECAIYGRVGQVFDARLHVNVPHERTSTICVQKLTQPLRVICSLHNYIALKTMKKKSWIYAL